MFTAFQNSQRAKAHRTTPPFRAQLYGYETPRCDPGGKLRLVLSFFLSWFQFLTLAFCSNIHHDFLLLGGDLSDNWNKFSQARKTRSSSKYGKAEQQKAQPYMQHSVALTVNPSTKAKIFGSSIVTRLRYPERQDDDSEDSLPSLFTCPKPNREIHPWYPANEMNWNGGGVVFAPTCCMLMVNQNLAYKTCTASH